MGVVKKSGVSRPHLLGTNFLSLIKIHCPIPSYCNIIIEGSIDLKTREMGFIQVQFIRSSTWLTTVLYLTSYFVL